MPHLGAVVVQLEGQHHGPVDVDFLGPVNILRADLQAGTGALPGKLGSLRVGDVTDLILFSGSLGGGAGGPHTFPNTLSLQPERAEVGAPNSRVPLWVPAGSEWPLQVSSVGQVVSAQFPPCAAPGTGQ